MTFDKLQQYFVKNNPIRLVGHEALGEFSIFTQRYKQYSRRHPDLQPMSAAVVLLIHEKQNQPWLTFIKRASHPNDQNHSGQIAFPGGKKEDNESLTACARRETEEEIGIDIPPTQSLYPLSPYYVQVSNFMIYPYVTFLKTLPNYRIDSTEVAEVIEVNLTYLEKDFPVLLKNTMIRNQAVNDLPYYDIQGHTLWGATAIIFSEFLALFRSA